ncbi:hypothetical protein D3Y57_08045 [Sphingomonas paeninsulae]|uniref:Non-contractile tail sheath TIM barrel domain-containing protein n=1 Tax=Sphingomonas paeninsulae TaxID=2319844 RepID=A0A494TF35_SPHPE|nr:hypothetical protein D3Y57_08045 [Sphingomonas paeninsulae]
MNKAERWLVRIEPALLNIQIVEEGRAMTDGKTAIATDGAKAKRVRAKKPALRTVVKPRERWTARKQEMFVTSLAVTGNVSLSLVEAGMSQTGLYKLRKRSPAFCTAWDAALDLGYAPPSVVLSPSNAGAMAYLKAVARAFVGIAVAAGQVPRFQIGEPWWWTLPGGRICLYDAAAVAAFNLVAIADVAEF